MNDIAGGSLSGSFSYRLGMLGGLALERFAEEVAEWRLKPRHVALLLLLSAGEAPSQHEVAARMRVAPSLVVSLADHLEGMGAVRRGRDRVDRRRQVLSLTPYGRELLTHCGGAAETVDAELMGALPTAQRKALDRALRTLAEGARGTGQA